MNSTEPIYPYCPLPRDGKVKCGYCGRIMKPRRRSNDPAYCSYECGVNGQPDKAKAAIVNKGGLNAS